MSIVSILERCRICNSNDLVNVINLGEQVITSRFPVYGDFSTPKTSIILCMCRKCSLIQLRETTDSSELYEHEYGYRSGISNTMRSHLKAYQEEILSKVTLKPGDTIVDIGSNDSTMLQYYSSDLQRIGVDPTGKQFQEYYGDVDLLPTYFTLANFQEKYGVERRVKAVSSISMFYDLPDPVQFAKDIHAILEEDGIWTCEQSYLLTMLRSNSIDTICHEHLEYYSLHPVKDIADRAGFKIIDVKFNDCNGGSFRIYFAKKTSTYFEECTELITSILQEESSYGIFKEDTFKRFMNDCDYEIYKLVEFIENAVLSNKKTVQIYGASTKGNCLLQYADLGEYLIRYAVERNPKKVGKMTSTGIEIILEETMRANPPDFLLVLPWHFREEIVARESEYLKGGGQLIFPFPHFEIVSHLPKMMITGASGFLGKYMQEKFQSEYTLYGIQRSAATVSSVHSPTTIFSLDMNEQDKLETVLETVKPDVILHLASISAASYAFQHPIETLKSNGLLTAYLCDIIHRHGWQNTKLINASSSFVYNGHHTYEIKEGENDNYKYHLHPYSIAKIMGSSMVDFYRETYHYPFSNAVIFTTESSKKRGDFLLNKIAAHARDWKEVGSGPVLTLGNLDSFRNIVHPIDVADAFQTILQHSSCGDNFLISADSSYKVEKIVLDLYSAFNIVLEKRENNIYYDKESNLPAIRILTENQNGIETAPIHIYGYARKLRELGWVPKNSLEDILREFV
jgi:GDP-D-mannose dehydratase